LFSCHHGHFLQGDLRDLHGTASIHVAPQHG